jgi:hypothetical protein
MTRPSPARPVAAALLTLTALAGCGGGTSGGVDWANYDQSVRPRIDALAAAKDCAGLQNEFDTADANDAAQRSRTGDGNADLLDYIDQQLRDAGCYE